MSPPFHSRIVPVAPGFRVRCPSGMTLLELTIVILVLLSLVSILFVGSRAWKRGSDRAMCIMHISVVQKAVRSFSNVRGFQPGETVTDLPGQIIGTRKFLEAIPSCPSHGTYRLGEGHGADTIPPVGVIYMECSLAGSEDHHPVRHSEW